MCTLTYIPTAQGFILTHNRDESQWRETAAPPQTYEKHGLTLLFPKDGRAGGTWIVETKDRVACLLNGAFEKHHHQPPYRLSRGIVLLDLFRFETILDFSSKYDLDSIEPFTMIEIQMGNLSVLRWDGIQTFIENPKKEPQIWSSSTLYDAGIQMARRQIFSTFIEQHTQPTAEEILLFHKTGRTGSSQYDLIMEKPNGVKTLSISQIIHSDNNRQFIYEDLVANKQSTWP